MNATDITREINRIASSELTAIRDSPSRIDIRWNDGTPAACISISPTRLAMRGGNFRSTWTLDPAEPKSAYDLASEALITLFDHADQWWERTQGECDAKVGRVAYPAIHVL